MRACYLISLGLSFLIYKMGPMMVLYSIDVRMTIISTVPGI